MSRSVMAALGAVLAVAPVAALVGDADDADAQPRHTTPRPVYGGPPHPLPQRDAAASVDASAAPDARTTRDATVARRRPRPLPFEPPDMPVPMYGDSPKPVD